jgi:hypothetical protein
MLCYPYSDIYCQPQAYLAFCESYVNLLCTDPIANTAVCHGDTLADTCNATDNEFLGVPVMFNQLQTSTKFRNGEQYEEKGSYVFLHGGIGYVDAHSSCSFPCLLVSLS